MAVRARYYDLKNARWLQRDPLGFADGPNLYEAFGSNPTRFTDPDGTYFKLWSTWESGGELYWQEITTLAWWMTGTPSREFSLGTYHYEGGKKFVAYSRSLIDDPLDPDYYLIPFEIVEGWSKRNISRADYDRFVFQHGVPIKLEGGQAKVLKRRLGEGVFAQAIMALQDEQGAKIRELSNWATTPFGARTISMILSGGVDPITEREMTGQEIQKAFKSAISSASRAGLLERDGKRIRRIG